MRLLGEAGLPPGVVNFVPGPAAQVSERVLADRAFAGIHFTGSTEVFRALWREAATNLASYASYPRLVGETGGEDLLLPPPRAHPRPLAPALGRGARENPGHKRPPPSPAL